MTQPRKVRQMQDPSDPKTGIIVIGERDTPLPKDAVLSLTLGENFNLFRVLSFALMSQFIIRQLKYVPGLHYAELKGHIPEGYGLTMSVFDRKAMRPFRDKGAHGLAIKLFSWIFYSGKARSYFLTIPAEGSIPTIPEALELLRTYGKYNEGNRTVRPARPAEAAAHRREMRLSS